MTDEAAFLREALTLAFANSERGGRPFGAVLVRDGEVVATGVNEILSSGDPTAHAEMNAIRAASRVFGAAGLRGSQVYASGHPCPMCLAAMRLAGIDRVAYAYSNDEGAPYGLSTAAIYEDLAKPFAEQSMAISHIPVRLKGKPGLYAEWKRKQDANV